MTTSEAKPIERLWGVAVCLAALAAGIAAGLGLRASGQPPDLAQRRQEVEGLSPAEKDRLYRRYVRFVKLGSDQQQRLRDLQEQLSAAHDAAELRNVMNQYHEWLKTISPTQRAELLALASDADKRLLRVMEIRPLERDDLRAFWDWGRSQIAPKLIANLPEKLQGFYKNRDTASLVHTFLDRSYRGRRSFGPSTRELRKSVKLTADDVQALLPALSTVPRTVLESQPTLDDKLDHIRRWAGQRPRFDSGDPQISRTREDELVRYFLSDSLTDEDRDELLDLPLPDRNRRLREKYYEHKYPERSRRFQGRPGFPRGRGDGPGGKGDPPRRGREKPKQEPIG